MAKPAARRQAGPLGDDRGGVGGHPPGPEPVLYRFGEAERAFHAAQCRVALTRGDEAAALAALLAADLAQPELGVFSLDVFDTLLLRNDRSEAGRFYDMSVALCRQLQLPQSPEGVLHARFEAASLSYRTYPAIEGCREGVIDDIHAIWADILGLPESACATMLDIELAVEAANLTPNALLVDLCRQAAARGMAVILISDMYLRATHIAELLARLDLPADLVSQIYSSADHQYSKRSGRIFAPVASGLNAPPAAFLHYGDSFLSDYTAPIAAGWRARHLPISAAEMQRREADVAGIIATCAAAGIDVRRHAKV